DGRGGVCGGIWAGIDISDRKLAERQLAEQMVRIDDYSHELEAANIKLEELARTDGLTGLHNHRAFQDQLAKEFEYARRYGSELSLILLDVDHFKQFNDGF